MTTARGGRVYVLTTDFRPMTGGVAAYLHNLWDQVGKDMPVTVLSTVEAAGAGWGRSYDFEQLPPLPQRGLGREPGDSLPPLRILNTARYYRRLGRYADRLVARVRAGGDVRGVFVGYWNMASHYWCRALRAAGIPYSLFCYGMEVVSSFHGRWRWEEWRREDFLAAERVIACSSGTAALARGRFGPRVRTSVLVPGVEPAPELDGAAARARELRRELDLGEGPVLLVLGRLVERKGFDRVLRCLPELAAAFPGLRYLVAGDGPQRPALESLAGQLGVAGSVRFLGAVDEATKWALYALCDLFVMPNRLLGGTDWEGFGIVFLEAALCGKPSVGGNNGGVPDAVVDGVTGLLVDPEDLAALVGALHRLLAEPAFRRQLGHAALERARTEFAWPAVARRFCAQQGWAV